MNAYSYDRVGNVTSLTNTVPVRQSGFGGPTSQGYTYDDLYRLTDASGSFHKSMSMSIALA